MVSGAPFTKTWSNLGSKLGSTRTNTHILCSSEEKGNWRRIPSSRLEGGGGEGGGRTTVGASTSNCECSPPQSGSSSSWTQSKGSTLETLQLIPTQRVPWNILMSSGSPERQPSIIVREWQVAMANRSGRCSRFDTSSTKRSKLQKVCEGVRVVRL